MSMGRGKKSSEQTMSRIPRPLSISLYSIYCNEETDEIGPDTPYVLITTVHYSARTNITPPPTAVKLYGPADDVDQGDTRFFGGPPIWPITGNSAPIGNPDDVILFVSMIERDNGNAEEARLVLDANAKLAAYSSLTLSRSQFVEHLSGTLTQAVQSINSLDGDDPIDTQQLILPSEKLEFRQPGKQYQDAHLAGDGGRYLVRFEIQGYA